MHMTYQCPVVMTYGQYVCALDISLSVDGMNRKLLNEINFYLLFTLNEPINFVVRIVTLPAAPTSSILLTTPTSWYPFSPALPKNS